MRFVLYVSILLMILPLVLLRPFFGLCVYYVVSLLQPKLLCWRPDFQDALLVGIPLVIGAIAIGVQRVYVRSAGRSGGGIKTRVITKTARSPLFEPSWLLLIFGILVVYIAATRPLSAYPMEQTSYQFRALCKILLVTVLLTGLVTDSRRFKILYIVVALSTAFWAIKGGVNVLIIGPHQVYGRSYDNNLFALFSVMTLPMVFYFALVVKRTRWRTALLICTALICLSIIGSRSRAGFVAFGVVLVCMAWTSRYRFKALAAVLLVVGAALAASGSEVRERIDSILTYRQDPSARSRFYTWQVAQELFRQNSLIGVGFNNFEIAESTVFGGRKAAHNVYLQNLSELGLLGHPLWLLVIFGSMLSLYRFMRRCRRLPIEMRWAYYCSRGLLLGLLAYCVHGFFHNEEYLELMFVMVGLSITLQIVIKRERATQRLYESAEAAPIEEQDRKKRRAEASKPRPGLMFGRPSKLRPWQTA